MYVPLQDKKENLYFNKEEEEHWLINTNEWTIKKPTKIPPYREKLFLNNGVNLELPSAPP